jgi:hypothetical protein
MDAPSSSESAHVGGETRRLVAFLGEKRVAPGNAALDEDFLRWLSEGGEVSHLRVLRDEIVFHKDERRSGRFFFFGSQDNRLRSGFVRVVGGMLCSVRILASPMSDIEALSQLMLMDITRVKSSPDNGSAVASMASMLPVDEVLSKIEHGVSTGAKSSVGKDPVVAKFLLQESLTLMEKFYGSGAGKKLAEISAVAAPDTLPETFLDKCQGAVAQMIGANQAKKLFAPLYSMIS